MTTALKRQRDREYYARNRERKKEQVALWQRSNNERHRENVRRWKEKNPERQRQLWAVGVQRRRSRKRSNTPRYQNYTLPQWEHLKRSYDFYCLCCGKREPDVSLTVDHVVPLSRGGTNSIDNLQPLCFACNLAKRDRIVDYRSRFNTDQFPQQLSLFGINDLE